MRGRAITCPSTNRADNRNRTCNELPQRVLSPSCMPVPPCRLAGQVCQHGEARRKSVGFACCGRDPNPASLEGLEPSTFRLGGGCSSIELQRVGWRGDSNPSLRVTAADPSHGTPTLTARESNSVQPAHQANSHGQCALSACRRRRRELCVDVRGARARGRTVYLPLTRRMLFLP